MNGKIYIIGTGPGDKDFVIPKALISMQNSDIIVGYKTYIDLIRPFITDVELVSSGMKKEVDRCSEVLEIAKTGKTVSLISSGDAGIYGMAGIMLEIVEKSGTDIEVEVVPGISAATSAGALLGAPLMNDFVTLSLSDLMTPWELIVKRIKTACSGDFVMALYNPKSKTRVKQLEIAINTMLEYYKGDTPVGIVKHAMREKQEVSITTLDDVLNQDVDMFTTLVIGNSQTRVINGKMVTKRGYTY
ncbi:precorrin-3B C(17)-methyltransferase [Saccharicrinis aurantiacus]|uniref:precorrin-3B C(17)-methyltransferase n=1 Tax=Saccharicrinis aurantiacus TaxID=1849719 RepID=UPI0024909150|nr:precorrin-3B C(17)-methyltransferase [Saccharicrinis aurantiacus]